MIKFPSPAIVCLAATFFLAVSPSAFADQTAEQAAQKIVDTLINSWNAGDGQAYAVPFAEHATFRVWNGIFSEGREEIATSHQRIFDTFYAGVQIELNIDRVRSLGDDVAMVYLSGQLSRDGKRLESMPGMKGAFPLMVMAREGSQWVIVHFQNTPDLQRE